MHPIRAIYVVAPLTENIINVCRQLGLHLIDESSVLPIQRHQISYFPKGIDRRGWIFQQLLKLSADEICSSDHILVIDSDTLLIRPQTFIKGPYTILNCADEYHLPYFTCYERLIQEKPTSPFSFVCHHMLFERSKLKHLKAHIEGLHQSPWYQAIIDKAEHGEVSGFSEYETYGNFFISHYPDEFLLLYFFNANMCRSRAGDFLNGNVHWDVYGTTPLDEKIKSVSFHHFHW